MRTKNYIPGFKNSQKIRLMFDGLGIYTTVSEVANVFATTGHQRAANDALVRLAHMRYMAKKDGDLIPVGLGMTSYNTNYNTNPSTRIQVQVDLLFPA